MHATGIRSLKFSTKSILGIAATLCTFFGSTIHIYIHTKNENVYGKKCKMGGTNQAKLRKYAFHRIF